MSADPRWFHARTGLMRELDVKAVGYVRVRGLGADALVDDRMLKLQTQLVVRECERAGLLLDELFVDRDHRPQAAGHPALAAALDVLRRGGHAALVVAIFDRFARLDAEYGALRARAATEGWTLILAS